MDCYAIEYNQEPIVFENKKSHYYFASFDYCFSPSIKFEMQINS